MLNKGMVSIIVPVYNAERYIEETIESVISQTYGNWELLVVDDCSTDNSISIINRYVEKHDNIFLINSECNSGGPATPRNIGIKRSAGEYIAFLDADDVWLDIKLEKQLLDFKNNNVDIVSSNASYIDQNGNNVKPVDNELIHYLFKLLGVRDRRKIFYMNFININSAVIKRKAIDVVFNTDNSFIAIEDWLFWIENLNNNKKNYLNSARLIKYRVHNHSISERNSIKSYIKAYTMYRVLLDHGYISKLEYVGFICLNSLKLVRRKFVAIFSK